MCFSESKVTPFTATVSEVWVTVALAQRGQSDVARCPCREVAAHSMRACPETIVVISHQEHVATPMAMVTTMMRRAIRGSDTLVSTVEAETLRHRLITDARLRVTEVERVVWIWIKAVSHSLPASITLPFGVHGKETLLHPTTPSRCVAGTGPSAALVTSAPFCTSDRSLRWRL